MTKEEIYLKHVGKGVNVKSVFYQRALDAMEEYAKIKSRDAWTQGYTCACANLVRMTGDATGTLECELLGSNISTIQGLKDDGVDETDIEVLKPTIKELSRKRALAGN